MFFVFNHAGVRRKKRSLR